MNIFKHITCFLFVLAPLILWSQNVEVKGRIQDFETGEAVPYATISAKLTSLKKLSDFEGNFIIKLNKIPDTIIIQASGFVIKKVFIKDTSSIIVKLKRQTLELPVAVIKPKANKALRILDSVYKHKPFNNPDVLEAYECENFNRIELAVNNLSKDFGNKLLSKKLAPLLDTNKQLLNEDGKFVLPVFISESVSDYYCLKSPLKERDIIKAVKITGVGVEDGSTISQLTASVFQEYNFYNNWITIVDKQFTSPLNPLAIKLYNIRLKDSMEIDGKKCYQISLKKKHSQDLLFTGDIWIEDSTFALKRMVLETDKSANINFIEKIKLQQEFAQTSAGPWLPTKTRITIDIAELNKKSAGVLAKYYTTSNNIKVNIKKPLKFYDERVTVNEDSKQFQDTFWNTKRQNNTADADPRFMQMVDSVKDVPIVKKYTDIVNVLGNGYIHFKKIDFGHYIYSYNNNIVEGNRVRFGIRTNYKLSRNFQAAGYIAYGFGDKRFKYRAKVDYVFNRKPWLKAGLIYRHDIEGIGLGDVNFSTKNNLFSVVSFFTSLKRFSLVTEKLIWMEYAPLKGLTTFVVGRTKNFNPQGDYVFSILNPVNQSHINTFNDLSVTIDNTYSRKDVYIQNDNERVNLGSISPRFNFSATFGFSGILSNSFQYQTYSFYIDQKLYLRRFGSGYYKIRGSLTNGTVPYLLLDIQKGNQSIIFNSSTFNMMNFVEFVTDRSISVEYEHHFEGLFLNRIPGIKKWNVRLFVNGKSMIGSISQANQNFLPLYTPDGKEVTRFYSLNNIPYSEVGYGVENIFRLLRVDFIHRLTYLQNQNVRPFGIKLSIQFKF